MTTYVQQRLTFFGDDDVTPLLGAVDGNGAVVDPSFSTDPSHARPYLELSEDTGESEINFIEGSSTIGQVSLTLLDKRTAPSDQSSGVFTALQASATTNNTQVLRRRVLWEGLKADGITWETLMNGVLFHVTLNEDLVSYKLAIRDIRERERKVRVFIKNNDAVADESGNITVTEGTCVFPRVGPMNGWGRQTVYDSVTGQVIFSPTTVPILAAVEGIKGTWYDEPLSGGSRVVFDQADPLNIGLIVRDQTWKDILQRYGQNTFDGQDKIPQPATPGNVFGQNYITFDKYSFKGVIAQWSTTRDGSSGWNTLKIMPGNTGVLPYRSEVFEVAQVQPLKDWYPFLGIGIDIGGQIPDNAAEPIDFVKSALLIPSAGDVTPTNGQEIYVRYISNMEPEKDVPKYIQETSFGRLLERMYDGDFSDPQIPPNVLYSASAMAAFKSSTPPVLCLVREAADDMRVWVQENIYKPLGAAPALDPNGEVRSRLYALPDSSVALIILDDSVVESASWEHGDANVVNKVRFTYQRDLVPTKFGIQGTTMKSLDVVIEEWDTASLSLFNEKTLEYKPVTAHSVILSGGPFKMTPNVANEVGWRLAMARASDVLSRFGQGAPECTVLARTVGGIGDATAGDWVVLDLSWLPDYATKKRGCLRLMQITRVRKVSPIRREFTLVDAGAYTAAVTCPSVSNIQQYGDGRVSVDVTAIPANTVARLEFALGDVQPPETSGAWLLLARTDVTGTFYSAPQAPGSTVWVRWRGEAIARQPSDWCGVLSITMADIAQMVDARLTIGSTGVPRVSWIALGSTLGVRIKYERHADGIAAPTTLTQTLDVDVNTNGANGSGYVDLPITLDPLEQVTVQVIGYPGFSGGAVSGTAGYASAFLTAQYLAAAIGPPTVLPSVTVTGLTADVSLTVDSTSPTSTFNVKVQDDAGITWTLVTSDVDSTPLAVSPGDVVSPTSWFWDGTNFEQLLNDVVLMPSMVRTFYAQAIVVGAPGITSGWVAFSMQGSTASSVSDDPVIMDSVADAIASADFPNALGLDDSATTQIDRGTTDAVKVEVKDDSLDIVKLNAPGTRDATTVLRGDNTFGAVPQTTGTSGSKDIYQTVIKTTASLADGASATLLLDIAPTVAFQQITVSAAAWVKVYNSMSDLLADVPRSITSDPVPGDSGEPIFEVAPGLGGTNTTVVLGRNFVAHNNDFPRIGRFYMRVTNKSGGTAAITVTIRYLPLEGTPSAVPPDVTTGMIYQFNVRTMTPVADGTEVLSVPNTGLLGGTFNSGSSAGSGPKYKTNRINGNPAIYSVNIGGNTRPYECLANPSPIPTEGHWFVVLATRGGGEAWGNDGNTRTWFPNAPGNVDDNTFSTTAHTVPITNDPTVPFLYHVHSSASVWEAFVGAAQVFTTPTNAYAFRRPLIGGYYFGGFATTMGAFDFGEVRVYSGALTDDEILGVKLQMSADWGVTL